MSQAAPGEAGLSRMQFLRGRERPRRPPWALAEADFVRVCTRCDACRETCPEGIVTRGRGGFPEIDFQRGGCTFCGDCLDACRPRALARRTADRAPWSWRPRLDDRCLAARGILCRTCAEHCEAGAIRFRLQVGGFGRPELNLSQCTGCGACVGPCPADAIELVSPPATAPEVTT